MTENELKFFEENKDKIYDLIRAVDQHENIRAIVGAGNVIGHPHLVPDYMRSHDIMSRLSQYLLMRGLLGIVGPIDNHQDITERLTFSSIVAMSC
jgi:hypothetical protein